VEVNNCTWEQQNSTSKVSYQEVESIEALTVVWNCFWAIVVLGHRYVSNVLFFKNYFLGLSGKCIILIFCCYVFLTNYCFPAAVILLCLLIFFPSEMMNRHFTNWYDDGTSAHSLCWVTNTSHDTNYFDTYLKVMRSFSLRVRSVLKSSSNKVFDIQDNWNLFMLFAQ
jgi:hypothetical protein